MSENTEKLTKLEMAWLKLEDELIYKFKAINAGQFNGGRYYDFYQRKEAEAALEMLNAKHSNMFEKISIVNVEQDFNDFFRVTMMSQS